MQTYESLKPTTWECKYHVVFIPKCRRKVLYHQVRRELGEVFRSLAKQWECRVEEGPLMPDHVHMLLSVPPKYSVSNVMGFIKGKSAIHLARVIELIVARAQTCFHIAETFPKGKLAKSHAKKLAPAGEGFHFVISVIASHTAAKLLRVDQVGQLGENKFSSVHPCSLAKHLLGENCIKTSSRSHLRSSTKGP